MRVVDTNVLLRYLLADHEAHFKHAAAFMSRVRQGEAHAYISDSVIAECIYVLTKYYRIPKPEAAAQLEKLLGYRGIRGPHIDALRWALRRFGAGGIDFVDAVVIGIAREQGLEVESFDKGLNRERSR